MKKNYFILITFMLLGLYAKAQTMALNLVKFKGVKISAAAHDKYVFSMGMGNKIGNVTSAGDLWMVDIDMDKKTLGKPYLIPGSRIGTLGTPAKFVFSISANEIGVVNTAGELWVHNISTRVAKAYNAGSIKEIKTAKYIMPGFGDGAITIITNTGEFIEYYFSDKKIGDSSKRGGVKIATLGSPAKFVFTNFPQDPRIAVLNDANEIWMHGVLNEVGEPYKIETKINVTPKWVFSMDNGAKIAIITTTGELMVGDLVYN
jgi:hypothetical protein